MAAENSGASWPRGITQADGTDASPSEAQLPAPTPGSYSTATPRQTGAGANDILVGAHAGCKVVAPGGAQGHPAASRRASVRMGVEGKASVLIHDGLGSRPARLSAGQLSDWMRLRFLARSPNARLFASAVCYLFALLARFRRTYSGHSARHPDGRRRP